MNNKQRKTLIIFGAATLILIAVMVILFVVNKKPTIQPNVTETIDPITGEKIITNPGNPERFSGNADTVADDPSVLGSDNVQPYFGNNDAFAFFKDQVLLATFPTAKFIKISPKNITRNSVNPPDGNFYTQIDFDVYIDDNLTDKTHFSTKYYSTSGDLRTTITDPKGKTTESYTNVFGSD